MMISTGGEEIIAVRSRDKQTMYLSTTMTVHRSDGSLINPRPFPVHTGMMIAATRDVIARAAELTEEGAKKRNGIFPERFTREYTIDSCKGLQIPRSIYTVDDNRLKEVRQWYPSMS